jgi:ABC-type multidrug transport system permease subunit
MVERNDGILERCFTAGVNDIEFVLNYIISQSFVMTVQVVEILFFCFYFFDLTNNGGWFPILTICWLFGIFSLCYGMLIACACPNDRLTMYMVMGSVFPSMIISGIMWPTQGMHILPKIMASLIPLTYGIESLRSVLQKGHSLAYFEVSSGILAAVLFSIIYICLCIIILKWKRR